MKKNSLSDIKIIINDIYHKHHTKIKCRYSIEYSNRMRKTLGRCREYRLCGTPIKYLFTYNLKFIKEHLDNVDIIKSIVLHEIAHAIVGANHNHDKIWKDCCISIGGDGKRCYNEIEV